MTDEREPRLAYIDVMDAVTAASRGQIGCYGHSQVNVRTLADLLNAKLDEARAGSRSPDLDELRALSDLLSRLDGWHQADIVGEAYETPAEMVDVARRELRDLLSAPRSPEGPEHCPVCGTPGHIVGSDEGTQHFEARSPEGTDRLDLRDELLDAMHEVAGRMHWFLWGDSPHDTEPGDGSDCHECYAEAARIFDIIVEADR